MSKNVSAPPPMTRDRSASVTAVRMKSVHPSESRSTMTLSPTTPSRSATETAWPKKGSVLKSSSNISKTKSRTGGSKPVAAGKAGKERFVFSFGDGKADGREDQKNLLGGKGANLHGMTQLGLPVPP